MSYGMTHTMPPPSQSTRHQTVARRSLHGCTAPQNFVKVEIPQNYRSLLVSNLRLTDQLIQTYISLCFRYTVKSNLCHGRHSTKCQVGAFRVLNMRSRCHFLTFNLNNFEFEIFMKFTKISCFNQLLLSNKFMKSG